MALVVVVRCLPSLFLFPIAGVVADRCSPPLPTPCRPRRPPRGAAVGAPKPLVALVALNKFGLFSLLQYDSYNITRVALMTYEHPGWGCHFLCP